MRAFGILIFIAVFAGISAIVMLLWNAILPEVVGCGAITYWQSAGLLLLARLLFGGFGAFAAHHGWHHRKNFKKRCKDAGHLHQKTEGMSREEKREYIRNFFCTDMHHGHRPDNNEDAGSNI
ncbi:MAG: hypothetical protein LUF90_07370 [Rikenellaceae bacterium]|nr:hypothetical protein [Rikenellaceae bacterium]